MSPPKTVSLAVVAFATVFFAAAFGLRLVFPPRGSVDDPQIASLRTEGSGLGIYSDDAVAAAETKAADLRRKLWNDETFAAWRRSVIPDTWVVQDLGLAGSDAVGGRRFAFQRPGASDRDWPEITGVLGALEKAPAVSVQSVALAVPPGYADSRHFTQCLFVANFYFADAARRPETDLHSPIP